jgi:hypothetical protein
MIGSRSIRPQATQRPSSRRKLEFRGTDCKDIENAILQKEARLKALWSARLAYQMSHLPPFEEVFRAVRRTLRQANLP